MKWFIALDLINTRVLWPAPATYDQKCSNTCNYEDITNRKIEFATAGLHPFIYKDLIHRVSSRNAVEIAGYIIAMKTETNLSDAYRKTTIQTLSLLSRFIKNKPFVRMTKEDVLLYLDSLRKSDIVDPLHKWIGTYLKRMILLRFFKWLHYPNEDPKNRKRPAVMENIPMLRRKEQSIYKPADLWTVEDDLVFLKYCPHKRDRCYHAISRDTSCRPNEILRLRIKDVIFRTTCDNYQYGEILVVKQAVEVHLCLTQSRTLRTGWMNTFKEGIQMHF